MSSMVKSAMTIRVLRGEKSWIEQCMGTEDPSYDVSSGGRDVIVY